MISWHNFASYSSRTVRQPRWEQMRRRWPLERLLESLFGMLTTWEKQSFKCVLSPDMSTTAHPPHREEARGPTSTIWAIYLVQLFLSTQKQKPSFKLNHLNYAYCCKILQAEKMHQSARHRLYGDTPISHTALIRGWGLNIWKVFG